MFPILWLPVAHIWQETWDIVVNAIRLAIFWECCRVTESLKARPWVIAMLMRLTLKLYRTGVWMILRFSYFLE